MVPSAVKAKPGAEEGARMPLTKTDIEKGLNVFAFWSLDLGDIAGKFNRDLAKKFDYLAELLSGIKDTLTNFESVRAGAANAKKTVNELKGRVDSLGTTRNEEKLRENFGKFLTGEGMKINVGGLKQFLNSVVSWAGYQM